MNEVTCNKCGWVHAGLSKIVVDALGEDLTKCFNCGNSYKNFRPAVEADAPAGVTLQPILGSTEK